jgi:hypothetical protein
MPWPKPNAKSRPKLRLPLVLNRQESEALDKALQTAIDEAVPGSDHLAFLYTLLRKNERILRKLQDSDGDDLETFDD